MATAREIEYLKENFDYLGLSMMGFYQNVKEDDYDAQIKRICEWFGITSIFQYDTLNIKQATPVMPDLKTFSDN